MTTDPTTTAPNPDAPPTPIDHTHIESAAQRIAPIVNRTPIVTSRTLDALTGASITLKCENLQRTGAFKFRGASNAIAKLKEDHPTDTPHVLTYSSGNHAQAVALASRLNGIPATIIMPTDAPRAKLNATRSYLGDPPLDGAGVVMYDRAETTREALAQRMLAERPASAPPVTLIPPYDHPDVIAGQGTAARELFEQLTDASRPTLDALFVCCGGGGLLSGCAIAAKHANPACAVIGVEPATADDATRSFNTRTLHTVKDPPTIADGARTPSLGRYTFPLVLRHVDHMMTVTDDELAAAMRFCLERLKLLIEPSGVLALAGVIQAARTTSPLDPAGAHIGVIVSGGNTDTANALRLIEAAHDITNVTT